MTDRTVSLAGWQTSAEGLGCFGMSSAYGAADWDESVATIRRALDLGVTLIDTVREIAAAHGATAAQVAIAWVRAQSGRLGIPVVPIPGTKRVRWLEENAAALDLALTGGDLARLGALAGLVVGGRY